MNNNSAGVVLTLIMAGMLSVVTSCDGGGGEPPDVDEDTMEADLIALSVPSHICIQGKSIVPVQFALDVQAPETIFPPHYGWIKVISCMYGCFDVVHEEYMQFSETGTLLFDLDLEEGRYEVNAGITTYYGGAEFSYDELLIPEGVVIQMSPCDNGWRSFDFDYYRQGTLNAMPKGLPDIQYSFDPAKISMNPFYVADSLQTESIEFDPSSFDWPDAFTNYMLDNLDFTSPYLRHLFAVSYFVKPAVPPNPPILMDYILGTTWTFGYPSTDWASFVQVEGINYIFQNSDESEAVSSTTIHELVHIIARPPAINEACGDWASQHVVGECVMEWLDFDSTSGALLLMCDKPVYITWPYTDQICDSCLVRLENATW